MSDLGAGPGRGLTRERAGELLAELGIGREPGLSEAEFRRVERGLGFRFGTDQRVLLSAGVPRGKRWPDWRGASLASLGEWVAGAVEGVLFDVAENDYWYSGWGDRPADLAEAENKARGRLRSAPVLVPIYGHRFCPALPEAGLPVFSVVQTDVIIYGSDLEDYLRREFGLAGTHGEGNRVARPVPFWSELAATG